MQSFPKISNLKQRAFARAEKITRHNLVRFPILLSSEHKSVGKPKKSYYFWYSQQTSKTQILMFSSFFSFTSSSTLYPPRSLVVASLFCFFQHSQLRWLDMQIKIKIQIVSLILAVEAIRYARIDHAIMIMIWCSDDDDADDDEVRAKEICRTAGLYIPTSCSTTTTTARSPGHSSNDDYDGGHHHCHDHHGDGHSELLVQPLQHLPALLVLVAMMIMIVVIIIVIIIMVMAIVSFLFDHYNSAGPPGHIFYEKGRRGDVFSFFQK